MILPSNAAGFVANLIGIAGSAFDIAVFRESAQTAGQLADQNGFVRNLSGQLENLLSQILHTQFARSPVVGKIEIDQTSRCDSGSIHLHGTLDDDFTGDLEAEFNKCRFGLETLNGDVDLRIHSYDLGFGAIIDATYRFPKLTLSGLGFRYSLSGSIRSRVFFTTDTVRLVVNMVTRDDINGGMTQVKNLVINDHYDDIFSPSQVSEFISGRLYDSVQGFVDVETVVPLVFSAANQFFTDRGQLLLTGANNTSLRFLIQSLSLLWLELDLDGDASYELVAALDWDTLFAETDLQDSDNDGIHDEWEQAHGLNPSDPADAVRDDDNDGFINIAEYLAGSDKDDDSSLPQIADLSVGISAPRQALQASTLNYQVQVENTGPLGAANVIVTIDLPVGTSFLMASASGWNCSHASNVVTCERPSMSIGSTASFTITVGLPLNTGTITNSALVSSDTLDTQTGNDVHSLGVDLVALSPSLNQHLGVLAFAADLEYDKIQNRLYVSLPRTNSIAILSADTLAVIDEVYVGSGPQGIALDSAGNLLYIALGHSGAVAALDLATLSLTQIDVSAELNTIQVNDVIAPLPEAVFVSGFRVTDPSYLAKIDTANNNLVSRVASSREIVSFQPVFTARANPQFLYSAGYFPNYVYKLDLGQPDAPLILEGLHGGLPGTQQNHLAINPDGSKIFLGNGEVIGTSSLNILGQIGEGISTVSADGSKVLVGEVPNNIGVFDTTTYSKINQFFSSCNIAEIRKIVEIETDLKWIIMGEKSICLVSAPGNADPASPIADLEVTSHVTGDPVVDSGLSYRIDISNLGPLSADDLTVVDTLPTGSSFFTAYGPGWTCSHVSGVVTCNLTSLAAGATSELRISISTPSTPGDLTNLVEVSSATPDDNQANNTDSLVSTIGPKAPSVNLDLGEPAFDVEIDVARRQLYASLPESDSIAFISLDTFAVTNNVFIGSSPHGIALDPAGNTLYVALNQSGAVAALDLDSLVVSQVDISAELNTNRAYDVIAPIPDAVFASGDPDFPDQAYIVKIDIAAGNQVGRVASNTTLVSEPIFRANSGPQFLYVYENSSPNSLLKLDLSQPSAPVVLQTSGESEFLQDVSVDGSRLIFQPGKVSSTDTFNQLGRLTREYGGNALGTASVSADGVSALYVDGVRDIELYDLPTYLIRDRLVTTCNVGPRIYRIDEIQAGQAWVLLGEDALCFVSRP